MKILQTLFIFKPLLRSPVYMCFSVLQGVIAESLQGFDNNSAESRLSAQMDFEDVVPETTASPIPSV